MYTPFTVYTIGQYENHLEKILNTRIHQACFPVSTICLNRKKENKNTVQQHRFNFTPFSLEINDLYSQVTITQKALVTHNSIPRNKYPSPPNLHSY